MRATKTRRARTHYQRTRDRTRVRTLVVSVLVGALVTTSTGTVDAVRYTDQDNTRTGAPSAPADNEDTSAPALRLAHAELRPDGETEVAWAWDPVPNATGYRLERADAPSGPWLEVASYSSDELVATAAVVGPSSYFRVVALDALGTATPSPARQAFALAADSYHVPVQTNEVADKIGTVRYPADLEAGPFPLVLLLHDWHGSRRVIGPAPIDICPVRNVGGSSPPGTVPAPNAAGLLYLTETLAARGTIAVTIDGNELSCDGFIGYMAALYSSHLRLWADWARIGGAPLDATFVGKVDLARVGVVGHGRAGEAVEILLGFSWIEEDEDVDIASALAIAPPDFDVLRDVNDVAYAVILPSCAGQHCKLDGIHPYDRHLAQRSHPRFQVLMVGANHAHFNAEWLGEPPVPCAAVPLPPEVQIRTTETLAGSWFDATLHDEPFEPIIRAEVTETPAWIEAWTGHDIDLRPSFAAANRVLIDEFSGQDAPDTNALGQPNAFDGFVAADRCRRSQCGSYFEHFKWGVALTWLGGSPAAALSLGDRDVTDFAAISMRVAVRVDPHNAPARSQDFSVSLVDSAGQTASVWASDVGRVPYPVAGACPLSSSRFKPMEMLHTLRVPNAAFVAQNPLVDLTSVRRLEFRMDAPHAASGSIVISDIELSG